ncbi:hypothetical protein C8Q80DRAFT_1288255 [Daedaleopsis nitida]|nr:hypothetical protein C8Q80DRAFT_1288255 [Daedaleopsis nitida]
MLANLLSLVSLAAVTNAYWIFGGLRPIVTTRLDPVIFPNTIASHVHSVVGASRFKSVYDPIDLKESKCTTVPVQPDKSNYWAPQLYHQDQESGLLTPIPTGFNIYYLSRPGPKNETIKAFPPGLRMVAGDPNRRSYNASSFADQAIDFVCLDFSGAHAHDPDWDERPSFFDHNCPNGMRAQVFFPSCWDGVNLDSSDHKSHMAYPIQNFNSGDCPDSHPVHLVSLFYEMIVSVDQFDYWGPAAWVLASGDTTGYGHHGDFQNGWDVDLLQDALDNCPDANGNVQSCPPLAAVFDQASADACVLETQIVDENTGFHGPLSQLPGCNPIWNGTGAHPACPPNLATPSLVSVTTPLPTNWTEIGCIAEGTTGRALTGASTTSPNMTRAACAAFCQTKGFALAGVEFSDECYCDNRMRNGASNSTVLWNECTNHCAGNSDEICGGPSRLTLMVTSDPTPAPVEQGPDGWEGLGCVSDGGPRALTGYSFTSDQMTVASCTSACASRNFSLAGVEFARECYCGNAFQNSLGQQIDPAACNMGCSGDSSATCGGGFALTAFQLTNTNTTATVSASSAPAASTASSAASSTIASPVPVSPPTGTLSSISSGNATDGASSPPSVPAASTSTPVPSEANSEFSRRRAFRPRGLGRL